VADTAAFSGRVEVFGILREGLSLLPRAIGPFLLAYLVAFALAVVLMIPPSLLVATLLTVMEVGGLGASGRGAQVAATLPLISSVVWRIIQAYVALRLVVAQYRLAAEIRAGLRPQILEVFARPDPPLLPLASLVLVLGLGTSMGSSALVVPGVVFLLVFGQALPAMIFDGTNVRGSLFASWMLTPGNLLSLLGLTLILLPLAFLPSFLSYLVRKAAGPGASLFIVLPPLAVALFLLFLLSCLSFLVAVIVYQNLRAQVAGSIPAEPPETDGVPA
jgi:hypothetical protein